MHTLSLVTADGVALGATLFEPSGPWRAQVVVHGATAVPQRYYRRFACFLAERGFRVLTYDYRGVGESGPSDLRGFSATMTEWAERDAPAAVQALLDGAPGLPYLAVGHSFGGQVAAMVEAEVPPVAVVMVGAQGGGVARFPLPGRLHAQLGVHVLIPAITRAFGYLPAWAGLGEALPAGVAREWAAWCRAPEYYLVSHPEYADRLASYAGRLYALSFTDDDFAPLANVQWLLALHRAARVVHRHLAPADLGERAVGHFGAFRESRRADLWELLAGWVDDALGLADEVDESDSSGGKAVDVERHGEPRGLHGTRAQAAIPLAHGSRARGARGISFTMEELTVDLFYGRA